MRARWLPTSARSGSCRCSRCRRSASSAGRVQRDRDEAALARLVEANLRFVVSYAKRYRAAGVPLLDLIHQGNLGLMEAARRFDPGRNVKFITYAVWWIREAMMHALADQTRAFSFPPKLFASLRAGAPDVSLNDPVSSDGSRQLGDTLPQALVPPVEDDLIHQADLDALASALNELDGTEREIVRLRFGFEDRRAPHASGNRRSPAPVARARPADRVARERQAAAVVEIAQPSELANPARS